MRSTHHVLVPAVLAGLSLAPRWSEGVTKTWIGGNALWSTPGAWSPLNPPAGGDIAILQQGAFTCTVDTTASISSLGGLLIGNGMTLLQSSGTFNSVTTANVGSTMGGATFTQNGGISSHFGLNLGFAFGSAGTLQVGNGIINVTNQTTVGFGTGTTGNLIMGSGRLQTGVLTVGGSGSGTVTANAGTIQIGGGGGTLEIGNGGRFDLGGTSLSLGTLQMSGGTFNCGSTFSYSRINLASGTFTIANGASLSIPAAATVFVSGGRLNAGGPDGTIIVSGGQYAQIAGTATVGQIAVAGGGILDLAGGSFSATTSNSAIGTSAGVSVMQVIGATSARFEGLTLAPVGGAAVQATIGGGTIDITGLLGIAPLGVATWSQSGGVANTGTFATVIASSLGSIGTMAFSGTASFSTDSMAVGFTGTAFVQQSGTANVNVAGAITLSPGFGSGMYQLLGGTLSAATIDVQSGGTFAQSGGAISNTTRVNLNGGFITALNNTGQLIFNSGSAGTVNNAGSVTLIGTGTFSLLSFVNNAAGSIEVPTGRSINVATQASLAGSTVVSGGTFSAGSIGVAVGDAGSVIQNDGVVATSLVSVADGAAGTYSLAGGQLTAGSILVGGSGLAGTSGTFSQSAGLASVSGGVSLGPAAARYILSGGTLSAASLSVSAGATFSQSGGTLGIANSLITSGTVLFNGGVANCGSVQIGANAAVNLSGGILNTTVIELSGGVLTPTSGFLNADRIHISGGTLAASAGMAYSAVVDQTGGTLSGTLVNNGTFNYSGGIVSGRIINNNVVNLLGNLVAGDGVANHASLTVGLGRALTGNGLGIENFGTLVLAGGSLTGSPKVLNASGAAMMARGTISSTGSFINNGMIDVTGSLAISGPVENNGVITAGLAESLTASGGLTNLGQIQLAGGMLGGAIVNTIAGTIRGFGQVNAGINFNSGIIFADSVQPLTISALNTNTASGQLRIADGATMNLSAPVTNSGIIQLDGPGSNLVGTGTIVNVGGTLRGAGRITNPIQNGGVVRAENGDLDIATPLLNVTAGRVEIPAGRRITFTAGMLPNEGLITLGGGTLDHGLAPFTNSTGRIEGRGAIRAGAIVNTGSITLSGGNSEMLASLTQNSPAKTIITGFGTTTFFGDVTNGVGTELRVSTGATAIFLGDVNGLSRITGGGVKVFEGSAAGGPLVTPGSSIVEPGATLETSGVRETSLTVRGSASIDNTITSRLNTLTIAGSPDAWTGRFDLDNGVLILDYTGGSPRGVVENQVRSGFNGGAWTGAGIRSSSAGVVGNRAVGFAESADLGSPPTFLGEPIDGSTLLLRFTLPGDANLSGTVNISDFALLAANFNLPGYWANGDFTYDGSTNIGDFALLAANFNLSLPVGLPRGSAVPEPVTGGVAVWLALACRRRR